MLNRWSDKDTAGMDELSLLVYQSRLVGADSALVVWGGGNTSLKLMEKDFRGRDTHVMRIKGSGSDLKSIERRHFPAIRMEDVLPLFQREDMSDEEMVAYLDRCLMDPGSPRPSIETLLHAFLPHKSVVHSHADAIVSLTNTKNAHELLAAVYRDQVAPINYRRPGFLLSKEVAQATMEHPKIQGVVLMNHGLVTWGDTPKEAYDVHIALATQAEEFSHQRSVGRKVFGVVKTKTLDTEKRHSVAAAVAPTLRGLVSRRQRAVLRYDDSPDVLEFANSSLSNELSMIGPATPDHLVQTKRKPMWVDVGDPTDVSGILQKVRRGVEEFAEEYIQWYSSYTTGKEPMQDPYPRVVLVPGVGMWTTGRDARAALIVGDVYHHTISVIGSAQVISQYTSITPKDAFDVEYWPLELYKLTLAPPEKELSRRIALVTGAAHGIGRAISQRLAAEGAHVVVTDIDLEGVQALAQELNNKHGQGRALACQMNVTNEEAVAEAFKRVRLAYGGLDILVSNAGIAPAGAIDELSLAEWQRALAVNTTGHFLVAREAVRLMREQGLGGSLVFIGTKNVTAPGKEFGAYSASKAAEVQLARVLAIENGEFGIRCNIVNPDAVFQGSGLWSQEVREQRARAHGIPVEKLEDFYRERNLLKARITPEDVAEAVLFLAGDRSAKTTGVMLSVDGGLREAFPR